MLRASGSLLPACLRSSVAAQAAPAVWLQLRACSGEANLEDPQVFKKFIGIKDNLQDVDNPREDFKALLLRLVEAVKGLPEEAAYRKAVEATTEYRLDVLKHNDSNQAVEEVLDAHMEELILECNEELALLPVVQGLSTFTEAAPSFGRTASGSRF